MCCTGRMFHVLDKIIMCFLYFYVKLKEFLNDSIEVQAQVLSCMINIYSVGQKAAITNDAEKTSPAMLHFLEDW